MHERGSPSLTPSRGATRVLLALGLLLPAIACGEPPPRETTMRITSPAFAHGARIPKKYTKEGRDVSPPLVFSGVPAGTRQLALICDDPDAPRDEPWVHWVLYRIPGTARDIEEDSSGGGVEGVNDFGDRGYGGPMPPPGHGVHHYHFRLHAVDAELSLAPGATKAELLQALEGHVIATAELVGTFER